VYIKYTSDCVQRNISTVKEPLPQTVWIW